MYEYKMFKEKVISEFTKYVGPEYKDYVLRVQKVNKVNRELEGITLFHPDREEQIVPTIYIEDIYADYLESGDFNFEMAQAAMVMRNAIKRGETMLPTVDYRKAQDKIVYQIISTKDNKSFLNDVPHREFLDMSIVYRWLVNIDSKGVSSVVVHNELAEALCLSENDLYELACKNSARLLPVQIDSLGNALKNRSVSDEYGISNLDDEHNDLFLDRILVLTNVTGFMGASAMLYDGVLDNIAGRIGGNFYIIPSSVNELIIIADDGIVSPEVLLSMVLDINYNEIDPADKLTDNVYYYDSLSRITTAIAFNSAT